VLPVFFSGIDNLFVLVYSASTLPGLVPWIVILIAQPRFRKAHALDMDDHTFKLPFSPISNYITLVFLAVVIVFMFINPATRISIIIGFVFLVYMTFHYFMFKNKDDVKTVKAVVEDKKSYEVFEE
jgi:AAT family amino acid transporter